MRSPLPCWAIAKDTAARLALLSRGAAGLHLATPWPTVSSGADDIKGRLYPRTLGA